MWSLSLQKEVRNKAKPALPEWFTPQVNVLSSKIILLLVSANCVSKRFRGFFWDNLLKAQFSFQSSFRGHFFT